MFLRIENLPAKKLIGKSIQMSYAENKTFELWQSFMKTRHQIKNRVDDHLYSLQDFGTHPFHTLTTNTVFTKWALAEVREPYDLPQGFEVYNFTGGLYAVFLHKGAQNDFEKIFEYIFRAWLPASGYEIDNRPHFELLGAAYKNNDPASEEEIWIPVKEATR